MSVKKNQMTAKAISAYIEEILTDPEFGLLAGEAKKALGLFGEADIEEGLVNSVNQKEHDLYEYLPDGIKKAHEKDLKQIHILLFAGQRLVRNHQFKAADAVIKALLKATSDTELKQVKVYVLTLKGQRYRHANQYRQAYDTYNEGLTLAEEFSGAEKNQERIATLAINLYDISQWVSSEKTDLLAWCEVAVEAAKIYDDPELTYDALYHLAHCLAHHRDEISRKKFNAGTIRKYLATNSGITREAYAGGKNPEVAEQVIKSLYAQASFEADEGNIKAAQKYLKATATLLKIVKNPELVINFHTVQADIYRKSSRLKDAEASLKKAFGIASAHGKRASRSIFEILRTLGDIGETRLVYESLAYDAKLWKRVIDRSTGMIGKPDSDDSGAYDEYLLNYSELARIFMIRGRLDLARHKRKDAYAALSEAHSLLTEVLDHSAFKA